MHKWLSGYHGIKEKLKEHALCILHLRRRVSEDGTTMASGCPTISMNIDDSSNRRLSTANEDRSLQNSDQPSGRLQRKTALEGSVLGRQMQFNGQTYPRRVEKKQQKNRQRISRKGRWPHRLVPDHVPHSVLSLPFWNQSPARPTPSVTGGLLTAIEPDAAPAGTNHALLPCSTANVTVERDYSDLLHIRIKLLNKTSKADAKYREVGIVAGNVVYLTCDKTT